MAKIIGHNKLWYKKVCNKCNAIILFDEDDLTNHNYIDNWNDPTYGHSTAICPECGNELSFNKYNASFSENTDEPIHDMQADVNHHILEHFKQLPHLDDNYTAIKDWGYTPSLYHFDTKWHVSWVHCSEGDTLLDYMADTPEEAIILAYDNYQKDANEKIKKSSTKYEAIIEDYYGHCDTYRFEANSHEEALEKVNSYGFNCYSNDDVLWKVKGEYVDYSHFDDNEQKKKERNYIKII